MQRAALVLQHMQHVEAAAAGQVDVEHQHVAGRLAQQAAQLAVVAGLADDLDVGRVRQRVADAAPDQRMVVAEQDADHRSSPQPVGSRSWLPSRLRSGTGSRGCRAVAERNRQDQRRAAAAAAQVDPAADGAGALVQAADAERALLAEVAAGCRPRPLSLISSDSTPPAMRQVDLDPRRLRMLADVGQRLLRGAVGDQRHAGRQRRQRSSACAAGTRTPVRRSKRAAIHCSAATSPCSRIAGRRLCMMRWLDSSARASPSRAPTRHARASRPSSAWRIIQARSNLTAVSEPPTSSWISRAIAAALELDAGLQVLGELVQALLRGDRARRSARSRARRICAGVDRVQQRRRQPRQVVLQQVVGGAVAHRLDRGVLADLARDQDERHVARRWRATGRAPPGPRSRAGCSRR